MAKAVAKDFACDDIRFVKELYPRLKPIDDVIERYRDALPNLPPIVIARDGILVDGFHRWQAHVRENAATIKAFDLGNLADVEIVRESVRRNAAHGQQLSRPDKKRLAAQLWKNLAHLGNGERKAELCDLLAVSDDTIERWTKDVRAEEQQTLKAAVIDAWLNCEGSNRELEKRFGVSDTIIGEWTAKFTADAGKLAPVSRQHFDVWQFQTVDRDGGGQQSYFGALVPQVLENLLWLWTEPGQIVVDPMAGSGTTIDVAKGMGRRVWAADIRGNHYSPHLPIRTHDILDGWPKAAPSKADLVLLDPPYWRQAAGRYSNEPGELAEMDLPTFRKAWEHLVKVCTPHAGRIAYIISPSQTDDAVIDHATEMLAPFMALGWRIERRVIATYNTQQATGQQVEWAREHRKLLKLYRDLIIMAPP